MERARKGLKRLMCVFLKNFVNFVSMNLMAFYPYSEVIFVLIKKRLISNGDALGPFTRGGGGATISN